jgi:hypothetical protein
MTKIEEKNLRIKIEKLEKENAIMQRLSTRKGFFEFYFEKLKTSKTQLQAFNKVNKLYLSLFGQHRYSDFLQFQKLTNFYNNA